MSVGEKSVIFLLGAGCSCDAAVPVSKVMVEKLEALLKKDKDYDYNDKLYSLYKYIRCTMEYGNKLSDQETCFNVESLLVTLHMLSDYKRARIYPFIKGYTDDLREYAGTNFESVNKLIKIIEEELPKWVTLPSYTKAKYYNNFERFQKELNFAIRIFSLNYDLCLENNVKCKIETGFIEDRPWDGDRFTQSEDDEKTAIYLYKLHGSIDWERNDGQLRKSAQSKIIPDIIFGTDVKFQAIDPYLFYLYEFRKYALASEIIISIGYSFGDKYINDLICQAMNYDINKKLLSVSPTDNESEEAERIRKELNLTDASGRIIVEKDKAKDFLEKTLTVKYIEAKLPQTDLPSQKEWGKAAENIDGMDKRELYNVCYDNERRNGTEIGYERFYGCGDRNEI
ncbi:MAG: SIR2 family protein [Clostridiales bacterium]|jgi:hypothetical protein|nr:SIR2 family protein [Clostridiales bacterium]